MKKYINRLKSTQLFAGLAEDEISAMLNCLQAKLHKYKKGNYVFRQGEEINNITILIDGKLLIQRDDFWGNRSIVNVINAGEMFG
ncbi:MAG: cyclic nucleotide-binding domain-containing protein, partial [Butyrivibrio sp.]